MAKYLSGKELERALFARTERYAQAVRMLYEEAFMKIIDMVKDTELVEGKPFSFKEYGYSDKTDRIFREMYSKVYQTIRGGVEMEWFNSCANNDELVKSVFGKSAIEDKHFAKLFLRNEAAMDAFFKRKTSAEGLNLSQRVWRYVGMYKHELENTLDLAIGEGTPANSVAAKIKQYLNEPDRWYRRFRVKVGEDENGDPIYGRKWKRRIFDTETNEYRWVDDNPGKYHPGRGTYRSSSRNAQRLARTETNIAYRSADYERWQQLPFIVGVEIKLSNNHPEPDICDDLKGVYPPDFKWLGWHPNCRCYVVPVLADKATLDKMQDAILSDGDTSHIRIRRVADTPPNFQGWLNNNIERYEEAEKRGTLPYFLRDNPRYIHT